MKTKKILGKSEAIFFSFVSGPTHLINNCKGNRRWKLCSPLSDSHEHLYILVEKPPLHRYLLALWYLDYIQISSRYLIDNLLDHPAIVEWSFIISTLNETKSPECRTFNVREHFSSTFFPDVLFFLCRLKYCGSVSPAAYCTWFTKAFAQNGCQCREDHAL